MRRIRSAAAQNVVPLSCVESLRDINMKPELESSKPVVM